MLFRSMRGRAQLGLSQYQTKIIYFHKTIRRPSRQLDTSEPNHRPNAARRSNKLVNSINTTQSNLFQSKDNLFPTIMANNNLDINPAQWSFRGSSREITDAISSITSRLASDRGNIINGYSASRLVIDKFLANPDVSNTQLLQISSRTLKIGRAHV